MSQVGKNLIIGGCAIALVGAGIYSYMKKHNPERIPGTSKVVQINGVITSEKETFFKDPRVKAALLKNGIELNYERWASGKIAQVSSPAEFGQYADFAFPSGVQTSDKLKQAVKGSQAYNIFYSPMVIATWRPIVQILDSNGLLVKNSQYAALDMHRFLTLMQQKTKWKDLKDSQAYPVNKVALIYTSDSRYSNASKMFMGLTSYILNGNEVVTSQEQANRVIPVMKQIMMSQGNRESSSTNLFTDYTAIGMGKAPMIFIYESEFLEAALRSGQLNDQMLLLYPSPTLFTKHVMIGFTPNAQKLVDVLTKDDELKQLASEYGFRFPGNNDLVKKAAGVGLNIPPTVFDVIDPPSFDILAQMADAVESK